MAAISPWFIRTTRRSAAIPVLAVMAAYLSFAGILRAADQTSEQAVSLLTYGQWHFDGTGWSRVRVFKSDGTFTSHDHTGGTWRIVDGVLELTFQDPAAGKQRFMLPIDPGGTHGFEENGRPINIYRDPKDGAAPAAAYQEVQAGAPQMASKVIQTYRNSLVFVSGSEGAGSGFVAAINGANYLVTNAHVAAALHDAAFVTLDGAPVRTGAASVAIGEDIFCMALPAGGTPFQIMKSVDADAALGDPVVVLGNAQGAGVVNAITGTLVGIGAGLVETDAQFVPGNSGSPIFDLKTGAVVGVATFVVANQYDSVTRQKLQQPVIRRFGYRLDSIKKWQAVNWREFQAEADRMQAIETLTRDLIDLFQDLDENKGKPTPGRHLNPVLKNRIDDWLEEKGAHPSQQQAADADKDFLSSLKFACEEDVTAAQRQFTYDYFQRQLARQKQVRDMMAKDFEKYIWSGQQ